jgi:glycosyltransferase involved in cell wall biosynthesis
VVHLVDPVMLGAAALVAARFLQKPLISSYHTNLAAYCHHFGISMLAEPMLQYNRLIHNQCDLTFCPSPSTLSALRRQGFQNLRIWPRGVDTTLFQPQRRSAALRASWLQERNDPALSVTDETVIVLYVGRISQEKNLRLLVQAYQSMDQQRCHLVMVGDGPARAEIQQELAGLPVTFTGYLKGEELATAYASADIFAFPSHTETFGQVVLEAMASGLPVVALHSEGVCDLVAHEHTGLLDEQRTDEEKQLAGYQKLLQALVQQREMRLAMGHTARIEAGRCSWHEAMQYLVKGYYDVVQSTQVRAAA